MVAITTRFDSGGLALCVHFKQANLAPKSSGQNIRRTGYISPVGAIQQFYAVGSFVIPHIPLIVIDSVSTTPGTYGTLGNYYQTTGVSINGDQQSGVPNC